MKIDESKSPEVIVIDIKRSFRREAIKRLKMSLHPMFIMFIMAVWCRYMAIKRITFTFLIQDEKDANLLAISFMIFAVVILAQIVKDILNILEEL